MDVVTMTIQELLKLRHRSDASNAGFVLKMRQSCAHRYRTSGAQVDLRDLLRAAAVERVCISDGNVSW